MILIENTAFDNANAGKENLVFVFVIGVVEYKMICCFCFQATSARCLQVSVSICGHKGG